MAPPTTTPIVTATSALATDEAVPCTTRENRSRPRWSVPNQWSALGPRSLSAGTPLTGSWLAKSPGQERPQQHDQQHDERDQHGGRHDGGPAADRCGVPRADDGGGGHCTLTCLSRVGCSGASSGPAFPEAERRLRPHPRVEQRIDEVGEQVDDDEHDGGQRDDRLEHRQVLRGDGPLHQAADAGAAEDRLDDQRAAQQLADRQRDDGHHRQGRRLEQVLGEQPGLSEPPRARHGRVLLPGLVVEPRDEHLGDLGGDRDAERDGGEERRPHAVRLDHAEEPELEREDLDEQQADHEGGHRQEQRRERPQHALPVLSAAGSGCRRR